MGRKERRMIARYRNEMRGNYYWREEEDRKCRVCGKRTESLEHVMRECEKTEEDERGGIAERGWKRNRSDEKDRKKMEGE